MNKLAFVALLLAACGGKSKSAEAPHNEALSSLPAGVHGCSFTAEGTTYGPHRCDVADGSPRTIEKLSGMELLTGSIAGTGDKLTISATGGCAELGTACEQPFTIELTRNGDAWSGPVTGASDWWLNGATFEITDAAGYGGDAYGGAETGEWVD